MTTYYVEVEPEQGVQLLAELRRRRPRGRRYQAVQAFTAYAVDTTALVLDGWAAEVARSYGYTATTTWNHGSAEDSRRHVTANILAAQRYAHELNNRLAAVPPGGTLQLEAGLHYAGAGLQVPAGVTLAGRGSGETFIVAAPGPAITRSVVTLSGANAALTDVTVDCQCPSRISVWLKALISGAIWHGVEMINTIEPFVEDVEVLDSVVDGFYLSHGGDLSSEQREDGLFYGNQGGLLRNIRSRRSRRQALSITACSYTRFENAILNDCLYDAATHRGFTDPETGLPIGASGGGLNIEPNPDCLALDLVFHNIRCNNNSGNGAAVKNQYPGARVENLLITGDLTDLSGNGVTAFKVGAGADTRGNDGITIQPETLDGSVYLNLDDSTPTPYDGPGRGLHVGGSAALDGHTRNFTGRYLRIHNSAAHGVLLDRQVRGVTLDHIDVQGPGDDFEINGPVYDVTLTNSQIGAPNVRFVNGADPSELTESGNTYGA